MSHHGLQTIAPGNSDDVVLRECFAADRRAGSIEAEGRSRRNGVMEWINEWIKEGPAADGLMTGVL